MFSVFFILAGRFGVYGSAFVNLIFLCLHLTSVLVLAWAYCTKECIIVLNIGSWVRLPNLYIDWGFTFDSVSILFFCLVGLIAFCVQIYSLNYMWGDPYQIKFIAYLWLFLFFMEVLLVSNNFMLLFLGWEGVGICSFLLVSFWNQRVRAVKAGLKAVLFNKVGDVCVLFSFAFMLFLVGSLSVELVSSCLPLFYFVSARTWCFLSVIDLVAVFIFIGVMSKSVQFGLHVWVLDAMEGPTPVSALIHAATMVTVGVYLLIRCSFIIEYSSTVRILAVFVGGATVFIATLAAAYQTDLKSVIAYSTSSQLGYMVIACGISNYGVAVFHLLNHGFFKALLFLVAGIVIHTLRDEQDIRRMGGLFYILPWSYCFFGVASLSLFGVSYFSGSFSKEALLISLFGLPFTLVNGFYHLLLVSAFCTVGYSLRLIYLVFIVQPLGFKNVFAKIGEQASIVNILLLTLLTLLSVTSGYFLSAVFIKGTHTLFSSDLATASNYGFNVGVSEVLLLQQAYSVPLIMIFIIILGWVLTALVFTKPFCVLVRPEHVFFSAFLHSGFLVNFNYVYFFSAKLLQKVWKVFNIERTWVFEQVHSISSLGFTLYAAVSGLFYTKKTSGVFETALHVYMLSTVLLLYFI
jgi:NADH-ubiquinone oxidoreductase chain 5